MPYLDLSEYRYLPTYSLLNGNLSPSISNGLPDICYNLSRIAGVEMACVKPSVFLAIQVATGWKRNNIPIIATIALR